MKTNLLIALSIVFLGITSRVEAISMSDMQLNGHNADAAVLVLENNDNGLAGVFNDQGGLFSGNEFNFILKDDPPGGSAAAGSFGGIDFTLLASGETTSGTWVLMWSGATLPAQIDLIAVLKGGDIGFGAFLFDDELLTISPGTNTSDTWTITFSNHGSQVPDLSHFSLYGRDVTPQTSVPEPVTMLLFGTGLAGLAGVRFRRKK